MAKTLRGLYVFTGLCLAHLVSGFAVTAPPGALEPRATPSSTNVACGRASSASAAFLSAQPQGKYTTPEHGFPRLTVTATLVEIRADEAYACLKSVPNYRDPALRLLDSLRTYLEFQSTKAYLQDPPQGFLFPAVDLDAELDQIEENVKQGAYESEYDMQVDINSLLTSARDGHLYWQADLMSVFTFKRGVVFGLASLSSDGLQTPQVYLAGK
jgi:hypothetical protein